MIITILIIPLNIFFLFLGIMLFNPILVIVLTCLILCIPFFERNPVYKFIRNYIPEISKIKSITCGAFHTFVLFENGNLWGWGSNDRGQLGRVPIGCVLRPTLLFKDVIMVTARDKYSLYFAMKKSKRKTQQLRKESCTQ